MSTFLIVMIVGLVGMLFMALPGLHKQGHISTHSHGPLPNAHPAAHSHHPQLPNTSAKSASVFESNLLRFVQPRIWFCLATLWGAVGYTLTEYHLANFVTAAILSAVSSLVLERILLTPFWNMLLSFQGTPCTPLENLLMQEAEAVTPFRNGKGIVTVVRDGRAIQMSAALPESQSTMNVKVGDKLRVDDVDSVGERLTVTLR